MPIRFECEQCGQRLGIASRKAGTEIACPRCGFAQVVPDEAGPVADRGRAEQVDGAEGDAAKDARPTTDRPAAVLAPPAPTPGGQASAGASGAAAEQSDGSAVGSRVGVVLPRWTLFAQGGIVVLLAVVFFSAGYFIGRGDATLQLEREHEQSLRERTLVTGTITYRPGPTQAEGDAEAVIIIIPEDARPQTPIPIYGLRPQDPPPPDSHESVRAIEQLGGIYARADETGQFDVVLPDRGEYRVLLISRHATRPAGEEPEEVDTDELGELFTVPERLLSHFKYRLLRLDLFNRMEPIRVDFGEPGVGKESELGVDL